MNKPIRIEIEEWYFRGNFIQLQRHPMLIGKYEIFRDDEHQSHIGRAHTMAEAKALCNKNPTKSPYYGINQLLY